MERSSQADFFKYQMSYINTDCSPSHLFNNMSSTDKNLMFIHNSEVQPRIICIDQKILSSEDNSDKIAMFITKFNSNETNEMIIIKSMFLNNVYYVAVGLYGGFKLWSSDGNRLLFQIPAKVKDKDRPYAFASICEFVSQEGKSADSILCGDNYGTLYLIVGFGQIWRSKIIYNYEGISITSLAASNENVALGYENGEIHIIKIKGDSLVGNPIKVLNNLKLPCISMSVLNYNRESSTPTKFLIAAFLNGEVKLLNILNGDLLSSLSCHLRMINSLQTFGEYFITLGDDCYCNIFRVISQQGDVKVEGNIEIPDRMPVGVVVLPKQEYFDLVISFYDSTEIAFVTLSK